jgi:peptidylprolyl isomerase
MLLLAGGAAPAPQPAEIVAQRGSLRITAGELRDLLDRTDPAQRAQLQASPEALAGFVRDRLLQQALLAEAHAKGWDARPDVVQRANDARDAAIAQSYLAAQAEPDPAYPGEAELAAAYEANKARFMLPRQYHLAQIALLVPAGAAHDAEEEVRRRALDLGQQAARPHADFAGLARRFSQDRASAERGGELGWLREDQLAPAVKDAVAGLAEGAVSDPVRSGDSWHVLRLLETRPAAPAPLAEIRDQLVRLLRQARAQQAARAYVTDMLRREPIQINEIDLARELAPAR